MFQNFAVFWRRLRSPISQRKPVALRPARALRNRFVAEMADSEPLEFPLQGSLAGPLWQLPSEEARAEFMPLWSGQAASLIREMPAAQLVETLVREAQSILRTSG